MADKASKAKPKAAKASTAKEKAPSDKAKTTKPKTASAAAGQGTVKPFSPFNPEEDAQTLRDAMKGSGTNEAAITNVLAFRSVDQRIKIKQAFKTQFGKELKDEFEKELKLSGNYLQVLKSLLLTPLEHDVEELYRAMRGAGADEDALVEILCTRSNSDLKKIKEAYELKYHNDLEEDLESETSGDFQKLVVTLCLADRDENAKADPEKAKKDAMALYKAGEKRLGTDESVFIDILCSRSAEQIRAIVSEYNDVSSNTLEEAIDNEMSGDLKNGLTAVLHAMEDMSMYFARRLYWSMKGLGTCEDTLTRVVVSRCEVDMVEIKEEFKNLYDDSLETFIRDDTSGDYMKILVALVDGEKA